MVLVTVVIYLFICLFVCAVHEWVIACLPTCQCQLLVYEVSIAGTFLDLVIMNLCMLMYGMARMHISLSLGIVIDYTFIALHIYPLLKHSLGNEDQLTDPALAAYDMPLFVAGYGIARVG